MAFPFRQPVNYEDAPEWQPPEYATPVGSSESSGKEWKPPDYAEPVEKEPEKKKKSSIKDFLAPAARIHPGEERKPDTETKPLELSDEEWAKYIPKYDPNKPIGTQTPDTSLADTARQKIAEFSQKHPTAAKYIRRIFSGPSPEELEAAGAPKEVKLAGDETTAPGAEKVRELGRASGSYWGGVAGSVTGDIMDLLAQGFDPRVSGFKAPVATTAAEVEALSKRGLSVSPEMRAAARDALSQRVAPQDVQRELPAEFTPVGGEEAFNKGRVAEKPVVKEPTKWTPPGYAEPVEEPKKGFVNPFETKPSAEFAYEQDGKKFFNVKGGPSDKSTVSEDKLKELGITPPEVSRKEVDDVKGLSGDEIRQRMIAKRAAEIEANLPQAARTSEGKIAIGADVKSLGKVLGTSLYKGDIAPIATKELLQNSIDAVRHLGEKGEIKVALDRGSRTIRVEDNGKGLTRDELDTVFTNLGASGKREDTEAAGGFGLAKAAPLLGGEKVEVVTRAIDPKTGKLMEHSFSGTPDELLEGVKVRSSEVEGGKTGTLVKVHVPKGSSFYDANTFVNELAEHSPSMKAKIRLANNFEEGDKNWESEVGSKYRTVQTGTGTHIATLDNPSATTELSEPTNSVRGTRSSMKLHLSNNGMYQGTKYFPFNAEVPNVPREIRVDIKSKVPEGHQDYPFTANREELRGSVEKQVGEYINENIVQPGVAKKIGDLKKVYNSMQEFTVSSREGTINNPFGRKMALYDPKGQITPAEMRDIVSNPAFRTLSSHIGSILDEAMKVAGTDVWKDRLEKVGIIFDDKLHGIHIPNPETGKSAILVNPFIAIGKMEPDQASANILHTILHEMAHVEPPTIFEPAGHNEAFTIRLGDIYGKFGARRSVEAQDQILNAIADPNTGIYNPEIQKVLSTYKESRGREATQEDLLGRTGIGSKTKAGGEGGIPEGNRPNGEGATRNAVDKLFNVLGEAKGNVEEQEAINRAERAKRFAAAAGVKEEGMAGAAKSLSKLRGEFEKVQPESSLKLSQEDSDALMTTIKRANITDPEKFRGYSAMFKLMNGERVVRSDLSVLDNVFGNGFADRITEMHGGLGAVNLKLGKVASTMKSLQNAVSLAAPLRHGIGLATRKEFYPAFADMFRFFGNKEYYNAAMQAIEERPNYLLSRQAGLFNAKIGSLTDSEEEFLSSYVGKLPKPIREAVGASQRAYTGFLNKLRADTFDSMILKAKKLGYEPFTMIGDKPQITKETKAIANYINNATGRGSLGPLNKMTTELNYLFWSPRMIASRINMFANPTLYTNLPKGMRLQALSSLLGIAALGTTIDTLGAYAGAKVSTNILSSDFGKARFGTHLIDPWGGFQQYIVGAARFLAGKTDSPSYPPPNRLDIAGRFLANKESPAARFVHTMLTSKFTGKSDDPTTAGNLTTEYGQKSSVQREVVKSFAPIFLQDLSDIAASDKDWSDDIGLTAALAAGSLTGMTQNYPEPRKTRFRKLRP